MATNPQSDTTLVLPRILKASRSRVFDAWTRPEMMREWFCPDDTYRVAIAEVDLRVGGADWQAELVVRGIEEGFYCAVCCSGLMLALIALGVMNAWLMVAIAVIITLEKTWRNPKYIVHSSGSRTDFRSLHPSPLCGVNSSRYGGSSYAALKQHQSNWKPENKAEPAFRVRDRSGVI